MRDPRRPGSYEVAKGIALPPGKSCADCVESAVCYSKKQAISMDEVCHYEPTRFKESMASNASPLRVPLFDLARKR